MAAPSWQVYSFHVNVGMGDGSIHVLVSQPQKLAKKCVLIDGGSAKYRIDPGTTQGHNPLRDMIAQLDTYYTWENGGRCQFDTVVLSHWDEDHYGNLFRTIKEDAALNRGFVPYLRYDPTSNAPATYLYAPAWNNPGPPLKGAPSKYLGENHGYGTINTSYLGDGTTTAFTWVPFCILRTADVALNHVLGADFFTNKLSSVPMSQIRNLAELAQAHQRSNPDLASANPMPPVMSCIGVNQTVPGSPPVSVIRETPTVTNKVSIACIIWWPDTKRISHYLAGDADQNTETKFLDWVKGAGHPGNMTSIKISHHGSKSSTPLTFLETAKPQNIVMSLPSSTHPHPTLELLWYIWLWTVATRSSPAVLGTKYPHFLTKSLAATGDPYNPWNYDQLGFGKPEFLEQHDQGAYVPYWTYLDGVFNKEINKFLPAGLPCQPLYKQYWDFRNNNKVSKENMRPRLLRQLEWVWQEMCHPSTWSHPSVGQGYVWPPRNAITTYNQIQAVIIVCRNDSEDGTVRHIYRGLPTIFPHYNRATKTSVYPTQAFMTLANGARHIFYFFPWNLPQGLSSTGELATHSFYTDPSVVVMGRHANPAGTDLLEDDIPLEEDTGQATLPPLPRPVLAPVRGAVEARGQDDGYYLYSSIVPRESIKVAAAQYTILSAGPLDSFLSVLHCANLCLAAPPSLPGVGPTNTTPLLESDEFGHYLEAALGLQPQTVSVINAQQSSVGGFCFVAAPISGSLSDKAPLSFSTAAVEDAFDLAKGSGPPMGILGDVKTLVFGLDTSVWAGAATASLAQLVDFADITYLKQSPAVTFLGDIQLAITHPATGKRNAVWFEPLSSYRTTTRLQMDLSPDAVAQLAKYVAAFPGLSIASAFAIARRTSTWTPAPPPQGMPAGPYANITYRGSLTLGGDFVVNGKTHFDAAIELLPAQIKLVLVLRDKVDLLAEMFATLKPVLGLEGDHFGFLDWLGSKAGNTSFGSPYLRRIIVVMDHETGSKGGTSSTPGISSVQIDLETRVNFTGNAFALFLITYTWTKTAGGTSSNTLVAALWPPAPAPSAAYAQTLLPSYEDYYLLLPPVTLGPSEQWPSSLDLRQLGGFDHLPSEIDPKVTRATLLIGNRGISFSGDVVAGPPNGDIPTISLADLTLNASYLFGADGGFSGSLSVMALIQAAPGARNGLPEQVTGDIQYDGTVWKLGVVVHDMYGSSLYQFFDSDTRGGVGQVLDNLAIRALAIEYDYFPASGAKSFSISGDIAFGTLSLSLAFTCAAPSSWQFRAVLDTNEVPPTGTRLGDVVGQIFGFEVENELPNFVLDAPVNPPQSQDAVGFDMVRVAGPAGSVDSGLFFTAWLQFDGMVFQALQYQGPTPQGASARPPPRRVFTMVVSSLPTANMPLVGDITQPFDEMLLLYVQPQPQAGGRVDAGITYTELQTINTELASAGRVPLPYRATKKTYADTDVVLPIGAHFLLVLKNDSGQPQVVLDYVFYTPPPQPPEGWPRTWTVRKDETPALIWTPTLGRGQQDSSAAADPGPAKTPCEKKMGPLTIRNVGFKYSSGSEPTLSIIMDASLVLGPIGLGLLGFSLDLHFNQGTSLLQLPIPSVSLAGLAVSFDKPPVVLSGMLEHVVAGNLDSYQGAVVLDFQPYLFQADGFYGQASSGAGSFTSAFVYFVLGGPLVTLEFAQIDDVTGGFGYNTGLHLPTVTNVEQFPLLQASGSGGSTDPQTALASLTNSGWFFPQDGALWLAAGLHVRALEMLQAAVVAVVEWNQNDVVLGLFGIATADMPAGSSGAKLVHVELGVVASVDFKGGTLKIEGQLAPSSFVLDPACHVTGGFALYQWFGRSGGAADGDFVFTVGGYHRGFHPPAQYPNPPRLAIGWTIDDALSLRGEAYYAMTPNLCMAGGRLDASLSLGPLSAWFDAYADMLINFKPFFFSADGGISVGVGFVLHLWICTIHINCEVGADLHLQGPPMSGTVQVHFWVFGFSIDFGSGSSGSDQPLSLPDFYNLALQADLSSSPPPHIYTCNEGLVPSGSAASTPSSADDEWHVRGAVFQFTLGLKFAIDSATVVTAQVDSGAPAIPPFDVPLAGDPVYARPMHLTKPLSSAVTVTITPPAGTSPNQPHWDVATGVVKAVPKGLWGLYSPNDDPINPNNPNPNRDPALLNPDNNSGPASPNSTLTSLTIGLTISSPAPKLSTDFIPAFDYATYFVRDAGDGATFHFPLRDAADLALYPYPLPSGHPELEWELVRTQWAGVPRYGAGAAEKAVRLWAGLSFAGWAVQDQAGKGDDGGLSWAPPTGILLVSGEFNELFLEAPRMASYGC